VTTTNRDFKVKHGLSVAEGGTFGQAVTVGTPTENGHAATKLYVDSLELLVETASSAPGSASNGQLFIDTIENRLSFYDGTGLIVSTFKDAGFYNEAGATEDAGFYNTNSWSVTYDGGIATEVFN